jgi:hypothetical protein
MSRRHYANAAATTLTAPVTSSDTTIEVASVTGLPVSYPFILILDRETASEEVVLVTTGSGTALTVTRGYDNTPAFAHANGAVVVHGISAIDADEANAHVNATSDVHGVTGSLVGTTDSQTLTNKTISTSTNDVSGLTPDNLAAADADGNLTGTTVPVSKTVTTDGDQTLTNKILDGATLTGTTVAVTTATSDDSTAPATTAFTRALLAENITSGTGYVGVGSVRIAWGTSTVGITTGDIVKTIAVTFPVTFAKTPTVVVIDEVLNASGFRTNVSTSSTTGATLAVYNTASASGSVIVNWIAIGTAS